jgi:lipoprotein-releasing system permease protein
MLELLVEKLGLFSAAAVGLIALGFAAMFLFFSGSAALILAHFLRFVRPARAGLTCIALGVAAAAGLGWLGAHAAGPEAAPAVPWWALAAWQALAGLSVWLLARATRLHRALGWGLVALVGASLLLLLGAQSAAALQGAAETSLQLLALVLSSTALGAWPLVIGGLLLHRAQRSFEWGISVRYLVARRRQTVISVITGICVLGVALGVAVITVVISVMNGFSRMWEEKIIGARAHFSVHSHAGDLTAYRELVERIGALPGVEGATPSLSAEAIVRGEGGQIQSVMLKGVDPESVGRATDLVQTLEEGSLADLAPAPDPDGQGELHGVIVGSELAGRMLLRIGDPLVLISPLGGRPTPLGPAPRMLRFRVAGTFRSGFFQFDEGYVYTSLAGAQHFMKLGDVAGSIEVRTPDAYRSQQVADAVSEALGPLYYARDWKEFFPGFFQALATERVMMFVLLSFIMVVAGFIIIATLIMMIMEKTRDIAILKTMGCDDDAILRIFAVQGLAIGLVGVLLGLGIGLVFTINLDVIQRNVENLIGIDVLPASVYQLSGLPYDVEPGQLLLISLIAMTLSVGATLLPSWQAARLDPAEGLRYE